MDDREVGRMWDENAEVWTQLSRAGCDVYRDRVNTPAFLAMLPNVDGLRGLDIGCGEGHNTRLLAQRGAAMTALDISATFIRHARQTECEQPLGIDYQIASGAELPFGVRTFDFAVAFMSLMDMAEPDRTIREAFRVIKPGGFFQFSITHPCFQTPLWRWIRDESGKKVGVVCGEYFDQKPGRICEWIFSNIPAELKGTLRTFKIPVFDRTLSAWLNLLLDTGFRIERVVEPSADEKTTVECPAVADTRTVAYFLIVRCRKPG
jgi:ubiquinone/menaquinone biosynthesis C-methylase UbiE